MKSKFLFQILLKMNLSVQNNYYIDIFMQSAGYGDNLRDQLFLEGLTINGALF